MLRVVAVLKKIFSYFLPKNKSTATYTKVYWEAEEHKIRKVK